VGGSSVTKDQKEEDSLVFGGKMMSLFEHLGELRTRLIRAIMSITVLFMVALYFATPLINFLKQPLKAVLPKEAETLHFTGPLEVLFADMKVAFFAALILGSPIWIYQFWKFIEPALYVSERRFVVPFIISSVFLFLMGILFSYYFIVPMSLDFLMKIGMEVGVPMITVSDYLSVLMVMVLGFGFVFETPLVLILLASLDVINSTLLTVYRKYIIIIILVVAALLTPPDPVSQMCMAIPLYIMFEISILIIKGMERRKAIQKNKGVGNL
jgi:sec-independent protein translocase protein TatC